MLGIAAEVVLDHWLSKEWRYTVAIVSKCVKEKGASMLALKQQNKKETSRQKIRHGPEKELGVTGSPSRFGRWPLS